jgi:hypothetical protein
MAAAGTLSGLAMVPGAAQAAVVQVTGNPVSLSLSDPAGATVTWDVDGAGGIDFSLFRQSGTLAIQFASVSTFGASYNGRGLIAPSYTDNVQALATSFQVGPTLATYTWGSSIYRLRNAMESSGSGPTIGYDWDHGFAPGENFFGFRFLDSGSNMHYGYGVVDFDLSGAGTVTISRWAYETTVDTPIHVGPISPVPEPGTGALMLLGLGAAGLLTWRNRRREKPAPSEQVG